MTENENNDNLCPALHSFNDEADALLISAIAAANDEGAHKFISSSIGSLFNIVCAYCTLFERLNVLTRSEVSQVIKINYRNKEVQDLHDRLENIEERWNTFLEDLDKTLSLNSKTFQNDVSLKNSDYQIGRVKLVNSDDNRTTCLQDLLQSSSARWLIVADIDRADARVVIVSFGSCTGALLWKKDTECPYPLLLDEDRQIYKILGFQKCVRKVWCTDALIYYAEQKMNGVEFPRPHPGIDDDPHQLGGDVILNSAAEVAFLYASKSASDRPSVSDLLDQCCCTRNDVITDNDV